MQYKRICVTGGAGFVGSNLAVSLKQHYDCEVTAFDSLKRRGSEFTLPRLKEHGVSFMHGDIRCVEDLQALPPFDLMIDCSAEPSVQSGVNGSPMYTLNTNLVGTLNCLEITRQHQAAFLFLSTSRVYPIHTLNNLAYREEETRFALDEQQPVPGCSAKGVNELFPLEGPRSLYGASKLAGELLAQEFCYNYKMPVLINRCGILTGPWQMGKVDQGVITLWVARHFFQQPLKYIGFGGTGKQVRDILHIDDFFDLLSVQLSTPSIWNGNIFNIGGGVPVSVSLCELTAICQKVTGRSIPITQEPTTSSVDIRVYATDTQKVFQQLAWQPTRSVEETVSDIYQWILANESMVKAIFA